MRLPGGFKFRQLFVSPHAEDRKVFYGLNIELSYQSSRFSQDPIGLELRPILGVRDLGWEFIVNPIVDFGFGGGGSSAFAPAARLARQIQGDTWLGVEYYSNYGPIDAMPQSNDQQHVLFGAFHVNLEEVEHARCTLLAKLPQRGDRPRDRLRRLSKLRLRRARVVFDHGGEAVELMHQVERGLARPRADERFDVAVARPHRPAEARKPGIGLDRDAAPSREIERKRRIVVDGVAGADIDVEASTARAKAAHEVEVLETLGVRYQARHVRVLLQRVASSESLSREPYSL